jgi:hypothetical protein
MGILRRFWGAKLAVAVVTVAAVALIALAHVPTSSAVGGPNVCTYYSDATYRTAVGARGTGCCGTVISWGVTTAYKKCQTIYCTQQICPN